MAAKKDILYMTTNRAMPGWVKIGVTSGGKDGLEERLRALSGTSVPKPFKRWRAVRIEVAPAIEKAIKVVFGKHRSKKKEFYEIPTESAEALLEIVVLCGGEEIRRDAKQRPQPKSKGRIPLSDLGIEVGAELFLKNDKTIKAIVVDSEKNKVKYQGEVCSLSSAASIALNKQPEVNGYLYWTYNGETLVALRKRKEKELAEE